MTITLVRAAAGFDPHNELAFGSKGGSRALTIVHEVSPGRFSVMDNEIRSLLQFRVNVQQASRYSSQRYPWL